MTKTEKTEPEVIPPAKSKKGAHLAQYQRRFQPGQSGNPGGRPRNLISQTARETLPEINPETGLTHVQEIVNAQIKRAKAGDTWAAHRLQEWSEGRISVALTAQIGGDEAAISSAKQKLMQKLIRVEAENAAGSVSVTISQKRLPFRPMRQLLQMGEGEHSEIQRS